jgi:hypothetical protein
VSRPLSTTKTISSKIYAFVVGWPPPEIFFLELMIASPSLVPAGL